MELVFTGEFPPLKGGVGNFLLSRSQAPPTDGLRVLAAGSPLDREWDAASGIDVRRFHYEHTNRLFSLHRFRQLWWARRALTDELRNHRYRLVTSNVPLPFAWLATKHKRRGHKVAVFCHGLDILRPNLSTLSRPAYRDAMAHCDLYIANSSVTARRLKEQGWDSSRIHVINPPVDCGRFHPGVDGSRFREFWTKDGSGPVILTVARLEEETKGVDTVIALLPKLVKRFSGIRYVVVGDGKLRSHYERMAEELHVSRHVSLLGMISEDDLPACYAACDLFLLLSRQDLTRGIYEGFGIVYREAMACGRPVIASTEAGVTDIIRHEENGLLVDPRNSDEAFRAIVQVLTNPSAATAMGMEAVSVASARPDWSVLNNLH